MHVMEERQEPVKSKESVVAGVEALAEFFIVLKQLDENEAESENDSGHQEQAALFSLSIF